MPQIALVAHQCDYNPLIRMITQLFQPSLNAVVRHMFTNIIHQQCSDRTTIVSAKYKQSSAYDGEHPAAVYSYEFTVYSHCKIYEFPVSRPFDLFERSFIDNIIECRRERRTNEEIQRPRPPSELKKDNAATNGMK